PLEADRADPRLLDADGRGELRPHADELLEHLAAGGVRDAAVDQIALEVRLDEVPAPRRNHCEAQCITMPEAGSVRCGWGGATPARRPERARPRSDRAGRRARRRRAGAPRTPGERTARRPRERGAAGARPSSPPRRAHQRAWRESRAAPT